MSGSYVSGEVSLESGFYDREMPRKAESERSPLNRHYIVVEVILQLLYWVG